MAYNKDNSCLNDDEINWLEDTNLSIDDTLFENLNLVFNDLDNI